MSLTPQHIQILDYLADQQWHCFAAKTFFMKDDRTRLCELRKKGFVIEGRRCDGKCGIAHNSAVRMRMLSSWPDWYKPDPDKKKINATPRSTAGMERIRKQTEWIFESETMPGKKYHVVDFTTCLICDCIAYQYRKTCKHVDKVTEMLKNPVVIKPPEEGKLF